MVKSPGNLRIAGIYFIWTMLFWTPLHEINMVVTHGLAL
jgi:hypothetical protein